MPAEAGHFYSGTSGLNLDVPNRSHYAPAFQTSSRLTYYASRFNSIEINSSFYKIPQEKTVEKWAAQVPDDFRFTFKLWREITHQKQLAFSPADVNRFIKVIDQVGMKKGCLLVQFAPSLQAHTHPKLLELLDAIADADAQAGWQIALEFRHSSWYARSVLDVIGEKATIVLHDIPKSATPFSLSEVSPAIYLRFHGPEGGYRGSYSDSALEEYAGYVSGWQTEGKSVYTYFNNTMGEAARNLINLNRAVEAAQQNSEA